GGGLSMTGKAAPPEAAEAEPRQSVWASVSRVLGRRRRLVWGEVASCGRRRRARKFLLPARPRVGRRDRKFLAKTPELWPHDAESWCDANAQGEAQRYDAVTLLELRRRRNPARRAVFLDGSRVAALA